MAQKTIDLVIRDAQAAQTVGDIKKQMRELKNEMLKVGEGSAEFNKLAQAAADLKEKMNDANDAVQNFNPDALESVGNFASKAAAGVSLVTGAMGLFGEQSEETEKALLKVQSAMAFAQGIQGVKDFGKALTGLFKVIEANPIGFVATLVAGLALEVYKLFQAYQDANSEVAKATRLLEKQQEATASMTREYDRQIDLLTAQGASEQEIIEVKRKKIEVMILEQEASINLHLAKIQDIKDNDNIYESYLRASEAALRKIGADEKADEVAAMISAKKLERAQEEIDATKEAQQQILDMRNQLAILDIEETKANQAQADERKKTNDKIVADKRAMYDQMLADEIAFGDAMVAEQQAINAELEAEEKRLHDHRRDLYLEDQKRKEESERRKYESRKRHAQRERKIDEMQNQFRIDATKTVLGAVSELFKDNAEVQKAVGAATTLIDTYAAAQAAFKAAAASPLTTVNPAYPFISAGLAVVAGLARVAAILRVDTSGNSTPSAGGGGGGNTGNLQVSSQPNISSASQPSTLINEQGQVVNQQQSQQPIWVSVQEIREAGNIVETQEERSRF